MIKDSEGYIMLQKRSYILQVEQLFCEFEFRHEMLRSAAEGDHSLRLAIHP
jgi:hypothetical protein